MQRWDVPPGHFGEAYHGDLPRLALCLDTFKVARDGESTGEEKAGPETRGGDALVFWTTISYVKHGEPLFS